MEVYATALVLGLSSEKRSALTAYDHTMHRVQPALDPPPVKLYQNPGQRDTTPFPESYFERVRLMAQFTQDIARPDGQIAQIGDCDNGRFLKLHPCYRTDGPELEEDQLNHAHLLSAISALLDPQNSQNGGDPHVDWHVVRRLAKWFHDGTDQCAGLFENRQISEASKAKGQVPSTPKDCREGLRLAAYPHFGLFVYRSARVYLAIRCGRGDVNQIGNHAHNDNLSFELAFDGNPIIVDPGTYVYTPSLSMRNRFRSTAMHSTLIIDGREQNDWKEGREGLFALRDRSSPKVLACEPTYFAGEHLGFGSPHRRDIWFMQDGIQGRDYCEVPGIKKILFHVSPSLKVSVNNTSGVELTRDSSTYRLSSSGGEWSRAQSYHSYGYGLLTQSHVISLHAVSNNLEWAIQA
jgi:hypothetical protein